MRALLFASTDWYLFNFRRSLASALREAGHEVLLLSPPGPYGEKLRELGFEWREAPMDRRSLNPIREAVLLFWLYRLLRAERPDVIHSFTIKCVVYGALAGRLAGVARVNALAGMGYVFIGNSLKARMLRPFVRFFMRAALGGDHARLILQNPDDIDLFLSAGLAPRAQIRLIPGSGVDYGSARDSRRVERCGRCRMARSCGRHASLVREGRHRGFAELPRRLAQKPDRGCRLRTTAGCDRCSRLPRGDPRRRRRIAGCGRLSGAAGESHRTAPRRSGAGAASRRGGQGEGARRIRRAQDHRRDACGLPRGCADAR